jgi:hypothetical protein
VVPPSAARFRRWPAVSPLAPVSPLAAASLPAALSPLAAVSLLLWSRG